MRGALLTLMGVALGVLAVVAALALGLGVEPGRALAQGLPVALAVGVVGAVLAHLEREPGMVRR